MRYLKPRNNIGVCEWCRKFFFRKRKDAKTCSNVCRKRLSVHKGEKRPALVPELVRPVIPPPRNGNKEQKNLAKKLWQDAEIQRTLREFEEELEAAKKKKKAKKASQDAPGTRSRRSAGR